MPKKYVHLIFIIISAAVLFFVPMLLSAAPQQSEDEETDTYRVAVVRFSHEICTFCPGENPGIEDWTYQGDPLQGDSVLQMSSYVRGFAAQSAAFGDMDLIGLSSPRSVFGGSSRNWNKEEAFDHFVDLMLKDLREAMPVDGIYLSLHGAMAVKTFRVPKRKLPGDWFGTVRLDALDYQNVDPEDYYPFGDPEYKMSDSDF